MSNGAAQGTCQGKASIQVDTLWLLYFGLLAHGSSRGSHFAIVGDESTTTMYRKTLDGNCAKEFSKQKSKLHAKGLGFKTVLFSDFKSASYPLKWDEDITGSNIPEGIMWNGMMDPSVSAKKTEMFSTRRCCRGLQLIIWRGGLSLAVRASYL